MILSKDSARFHSHSLRQSKFLDTCTVASSDGEKTCNGIPGSPCRTITHQTTSDCVEIMSSMDLGVEMCCCRLSLPIRSDMELWYAFRGRVSGRRTVGTTKRERQSNLCTGSNYAWTSYVAVDSKLISMLRSDIQIDYGGPDVECCLQSTEQPRMVSWCFRRKGHIGRPWLNRRWANIQNSVEGEIDRGEGAVV